MAQKPDVQDVQDFVELRRGLEGMSDFATAARRFLDKNGIAIPTRVNGTGNGTRQAATLREQVKRHYKKRRGPYKKHATARKLTSTEQKLANRAVSAALLDSLDTTEPRPITSPDWVKSIGALVRRGYAKKKGDDYIRTSKPFVVDTSAAGRRETPPPADNGDDLLTVPQAAKILKVSDSYVRLLMKQRTLAGRKELHVPKGRTKAVPTILVARDEVARYKANMNA